MLTILFALQYFVASAQEMDTMNEADRTLVLQITAKAAMHKYAPNDHEKFTNPEVEHGYVSEDLHNHYFTEKDVVNNLGRSYYAVKFSGRSKETRVLIWGNKGEVFRIFLESDIVKEFDGED
jgi:hypothetical protein